MASELWYQLPPDMNSWNTAVVENLARKIPEAPNYISGIEWSKLDPSTGDGEALITLMNGLGAAPVIIRGNKLAPIDILVTKVGNEPKFYPLSPLFLRKIYADNVIGEPVANTTDRDESYEGPSRRVQHIKTVDSVKYASIDSAKNLLEKIASSDKVVNWMFENMPETMIAIYDRANDVEVDKVAYCEAPELIVITKENNSYYINGEKSTSSDVGNIAKTAGISDYQLSNLVGKGDPLIYDVRDKLATIHIPTEQEVSMFEVENPLSFKLKEGEPERSAFALTTAYLRDGRKIRGVIVNSQFINKSYDHSSLAVPNQSDIVVEGSSQYCDGGYGPELFVSKDGYGLQYSIKSDVRTPIAIDLLRNSSSSTTPAMGMVGLFLPKRDYGTIHFGRVESYVSLGRQYKAHIYSLVTHEAECIEMLDYDFYDIPDDRLPLLRIDEKFDNISVTGIVGKLVRDNEGNYIIDGEQVSSVNCPYALMSKYAASYADAINIMSVADNIGTCVFEKLSAENDNPDKTSVNRKGTKSGTDDRSAAMQQQNPSNISLAQQTPETALSTTDPTSYQQQGQMQQGQGQLPEGNFFGDVNQQQQGMVQAPMSSPVNSKDMENAVQINSPQVMDAYLMGNLAADNMTSQDTIARTSDALVTSLSYLSQLLFLIRQGAISYISENDVQAAMNKVNDVAQSLGIDPVQIGTM